MTTYRDNRSSLLELCRSLRRSATDAESLLWQLLRSGQLGAKFRRQHQFGPYILDFYCHEYGLVIEVDGSQHFEPTGKASDANRTAYLTSRGLRVLRFTNYEVLQEAEAVLERIWGEVNPHPASPRGRGEIFPLPLGEGQGEG